MTAAAYSLICPDNMGKHCTFDGIFPGLPLPHGPWLAPATLDSTWSDTHHRRINMTAGAYSLI